MPLLARIAVYWVLAGIMAGCNLGQDGRFLRDGAGVSLYWEGLAEATQLQELYVTHICHQAGLATAQESCIVGAGQEWGVFVQAGLNDIDQRCDAYLGWLDDKKRTATPILQEIADVRTAATAIMAVTGAGVTPIAVVGSAFGLASNTFTNVQSRLVLEVNHSTVQAVVLSAQRRLRAEIAQIRIDHRPAALHVLRQYLRVCMPFTIETEINTTITAFERGGPQAVAFRYPLAGLGPQVVTRVNEPLPRAYRAPMTRPEGRGVAEQRILPSQLARYRDFTCHIPDDSNGTKTLDRLIRHLGATGRKDPKYPTTLTIDDEIEIRSDIRAGKKAC